MNDSQTVLLHKLLFILHRAFVETRNLALARECSPIADLADTFEIIPELMRKEDLAVDVIRGILREHQARHPDSAYDYLSILEMEDGAFAEMFQAAAIG